MSTQTIVDANILLVDGADSSDPVVEKRWRRFVQRSASVIWNDRAWKFKRAQTDYFTYVPESENVLPSDFGGFEMGGNGVYAQEPKCWLKPADIGEIDIIEHGLTHHTQPIGPYTRYSVKPAGDGSYALTLLPAPPAGSETTLTVIYLRRAPRCLLDADEGEDELFWIPEQWHDLVSDGAEWFNAKSITSNQITTEQEFVKLGLQQMRDREIWGFAGVNSIVGFMPYRRSR